MVLEGESIAYRPPPVVGVASVGFTLPPMEDKGQGQGQGQRDMEREREREMDLESVLTEGTSALIHVRHPQPTMIGVQGHQGLHPSSAVPAAASAAGIASGSPPPPPPSRGLLSYITGGFFSGNPTDQRDPNAVPPPELLKQAAGGDPVETMPGGGGIGMNSSGMDEDQATVQTGRTRHTAMSSHNPGLGSMGYFDHADAYVFDATSSMYSLQASGVMVDGDAAAMGAATMNYSLHHSGVMVELDHDDTATVMVEGEETSGIHHADGDEGLMAVEESMVEGKGTEGRGNSPTLSNQPTQPNPT